MVIAFPVEQLFAFKPELDLPLSALNRVTGMDHVPDYNSRKTNVNVDHQLNSHQNNIISYLFLNPVLLTFYLQSILCFKYYLEH